MHLTTDWIQTLHVSEWIRRGTLATMALLLLPEFSAVDAMEIAPTATSVIQTTITASVGDTLASSYNLQVVALPEPPKHEAKLPVITSMIAEPSRPATVTSKCFTLRAIVEDNDRSFAIAQIGNDSRIIHVGEKVRVHGEVAQVSRIEARAVFIKYGEEKVRCTLNDSKR